LDDERHANRHNRRDSSLHPKEPAPVQRRNSPEAEKDETGEQGRAESKNPEAPEINHEPENAGETSALPLAEPGSVDFHHAGRAESRQVAVYTAKGDEHPEHSPKRRDAEEYIHHHRADGANEHGAFAAETIGQQAVNDLTTRIGEQGGRDDCAHVRLAEAELFADRTIRDREIVAAHVERRVEQSDKS